MVQGFDVVSVWNESVVSFFSVPLWSIYFPLFLSLSFVIFYSICAMQIKCQVQSKCASLT